MTINTNPVSSTPQGNAQTDEPVMTTNWNDLEIVLNPTTPIVNVNWADLAAILHPANQQQ